MNYKIYSILFFFIIFSCQKGEENKTDNTIPVIGHKVKILEVIQANSYTYLKVEENNNKEYWMAIAKSTAIKENDIIYYNIALEMKNFKSDDLDRTFETILFVDNISDKPIKSPHGMPAQSPMQRKTSKKDASISIDPISGGITIAELYANSGSYSNKEIKIKGQVTKVNTEIMGRNWVHLQDGSEHNGQFDLTVTTQANVKVGDIVVFEGVINLNKDFGAGYSYDIIMEEAKLIDNESIAL